MPHTPTQTRNHQSQVGTSLSCQNNRKEQQCICKCCVQLQATLEASRHSKTSKGSPPRAPTKNHPTNARGIYATPSSLSKTLTDSLFSIAFLDVLPYTSMSRFTIYGIPSMSMSVSRPCNAC